MRVRDVMKAKVHKVSPTDTVAAVLDLFSRYEIRHAVVVQQGRVVGIVSDRDLHDVAIEQPIRNVMTRDVATIASDATVRRAASMLSGRAVGALPVVDDKELVGIITTSDVLELISKGAMHPAPSPERRVLAKRGPRQRMHVDRPAAPGPRRSEHRGRESRGPRA